MNQKGLELTYNGNRLGYSSVDIGELKSSIDALEDRDELHRRMAENGYLYLPGLLHKDEVLAAREEIMKRLMEYGKLDPTYPVIEGVAHPKTETKTIDSFMPHLALNNPPLDQVIHRGPIIDFYQFFLDGPIRYFDYTWFRTKFPGKTEPTSPHCDIVFMGRGTHKLFTSWVPYGDVPYEMGGLMLLEGSHQLEELRSGYGSSDVDLYCENLGNAKTIVQNAQSEERNLTSEEKSTIQWNSTGYYSRNALEVRRKLGGRWLTTDYKLGDLLIFSMHILHASSDNRSNRVRISSDTRYQLASEPADQRWIGSDPAGHGIRGKIGMIC
ncbi:MAG: 1-deoxypentalenic acid 11-beta-hydroxylase [Candidatus Moanabacter tarae]|uniref:1-deoxypentalenic acid 11-beta-hydroxylase n=1 Tax=Candidatus Moanibacter tarae TaxID=2200854 RepID=A0A2Z4ABE5_9BACT|nr:MAG: 1-deoxypentalenic acid 11-beta-hydroxylase [Candidatus Moanabacter tarae]|tara:strand:- start:50837 stop:51814 length:978 start_codon:yes stop_codon:yes gene_type:complete